MVLVNARYHRPSYKCKLSSLPGYAHQEEWATEGRWWATGRGRRPAYVASRATLATEVYLFRPVLLFSTHPHLSRHLRQPLMRLTSPPEENTSTHLLRRKKQSGSMTAKERHAMNLLLFHRLPSLLSENQSREAVLLSGDIKVMFCHCDCHKS